MNTKPTHTLRSALLALLGLLGFTVCGQAAELIPAGPMTAEARGFYPLREPGKTLNGLTDGGGFTDDGTIFLGGGANPNNPADYRMDSTAGNNTEFGQRVAWSHNAAADQWLRVDLGADYSLDSMAFFNLCFSTGTQQGRCLQQADIYYRTEAAGPGSNTGGDGVPFDNTGWTPLGTPGTQTFTQTTPGDTAIQPDVIPFGGATARYVAFDVNSAYSGGNVGISELLFFKTGVVADPVLALDVGSADPDYVFGNVFGGSPAPSRTLTFVNDSASGTETITIDSVTVTDDGGGVFGAPVVSYSGTNVLGDGDTVTIEVPVNLVGSGSALGNLQILTTSTGSGAATANDKNLTLSATVIATGQKLNPNPFMETGLADWDNLPSLGAVPVSPGLAGGSSGMARVKGIGDASSTGIGDIEHPSSFMQSTGVTDGAPNWQLSAFFTPINAADFASYADADGALGLTGADGLYTDRTFQLVIRATDTGRPFPVFDDPQVPNTMINIAYMPAGIQTSSDPDFYVYDGVAGEWVATGIGEIVGSTDNDADGDPLNGTGDGLLDTAVDPLDVINAYRILVTGTGFGSVGASYDITVSKFSGTDTFVSGTATGLTAFQGTSGETGTPAGYSFITSDISSDIPTGSNQGDSGIMGLTTPFWVDDVCFFNVAGPDPALTVASSPAPVVVENPATTASSSFTIRNDGTSTHLDIDSISFVGGTGFSIASPGIPFAVAPGAIQVISLEWDSATAGGTFETATMTISDSTNGLSADLPVKGGVALGGSVILDYNDMLPGDMAQAGNAGTGIGFTEPLWNDGTATQQVVAGDLDTTTVTGYSVPVTGTPQSQASTSTSAFQQEREIDLGAGITPVWFSFLAQKPTSGGRVGINFNNNTIGTADPRVIWIGNVLSFRSGGASVASTPLNSTASTVLIVGRFTIDVGPGGEDRVEIWANPTDMSSPAALGAPDIDFAALNSLGSGLTRLNPSVYGATGAEAPIMDNVRLSDLPESLAFDVIRTGVEPAIDPALEVDAGTADPDFLFGNSFTGPSTRSVTFVNNSASGTETITVDGIAITDDAGGGFTGLTVSYDAGNTGTPPLLEDGDKVTVGVSTSGTGEFVGELFIDTSSTGVFGTDNNDLILPLTAGVFVAGQKLNDNPFMDTGLAGWDGGSTLVGPGIAPGSSGMARVKGAGDPDGDGPDALSQTTGIPDGAPDWEFTAYFTPADVANFAGYVDPDGSAGITGPNGAFTDRTFQWILLGSDADPPAPDFTNTQGANTIINLAYLPDGITTGGTPDFYVFDGDISGTTGTWIPTGIGAIAGSIDNDGDMDSTTGIGDGLLDTSIDPLDVINSYRLVVKGTGFGTGSASYDISVTKVSGPDTFTSATSAGLSVFHGLDGATTAPAGFAFLTSDGVAELTASNSGDGVTPGMTTPFWVDDVCLFNGDAPDPSLALLSPPVDISVLDPDTDGTTVITIRNDGDTTNLDISSITLTGSGFSVTSPGVPFSVAPGVAQDIVVRFDSTVVAPATSAATVLTINSNDPDEPALAFALSGGLTSFSKLLANWDFEVGGTDTSTDTFAMWGERPTPENVIAVPGLLAGSTTAAHLRSAGGLGEVNQVLGAVVNDFVVEFPFAFIDSAARDFNFLVRATGDNAQLNIRYQAGQWWAFNNVTGTNWESIIDMTGAPLSGSVDGDNNGSLDDGGDVKNVYIARLTGSGWGTPTPTFQLDILDDAGTTTLGTSGPGIAKFQNNAPTTAGADVFVVSAEFGGVVGAWVDDICFSGSVIVVPAEIVITAFSIDPGTGNGSVTFTSQPGTTYELRASNDVNAADPFSANLVTSGAGAGAATTFNFTDAGAVGQSERFYRIEAP